MGGKQGLSLARVGPTRRETRSIAFQNSSRDRVGCGRAGAQRAELYFTRGAAVRAQRAELLRHLV